MYYRSRPKGKADEKGCSAEQPLNQPLQKPRQARNNLFFEKWSHYSRIMNYGFSHPSPEERRGAGTGESEIKDKWRGIS